jgi:hypothetical protein
MTDEPAIRRLFDAGWGVSKVCQERLYSTQQVIAVRAAWASERAAKIRSVPAAAHRQPIPVPPGR